MQELVAGRIQFLFTSVGFSAPFVKAGQIRAIATMSDTRRPILPDVPTTTELGHPNLKVFTWIGLSAPVGTPPAIIQRLNAAVNQAAASPEVVRALAEIDYDHLPLSPAEFGSLIDKDVALYKKVVSDAGLVFK